MAARATHLDSLVDKLTQPRVHGVIGPVMAGTTISATSYNDDVGYARDLGLLASGRTIEIANPIYREVIARVLSESAEQHIEPDPRPFTGLDGRLDMDRLLRAFGDSWRENGEVFTGTMTYHEVAPQLVLMAFLQRIVNGGGFIDREYGIGRGRIDLLVRWPYGSDGGSGRRWQREAVELKVWRDKKPDPLDDGLRQLGEYLTRLGLDHGALVLFDRRAETLAREPRVEFVDGRTPEGHGVTVLRA